MGSRNVKTQIVWTSSLLRYPCRGLGMVQCSNHINNQLASRKSNKKHTGLFLVTEAQSWRCQICYCNKGLPQWSHSMVLCSLLIIRGVPRGHNGVYSTWRWLWQAWKWAIGIYLLHRWPINIVLATCWIYDNEVEASMISDWPSQLRWWDCGCQQAPAPI